jgi:GDPmannose 4,6-dehydratase
MTEDFPFNPVSPYAVSKISAYFLVKYYRTVFNLKICTAFAFNHESPLRHEMFITRKITKAAARIRYGLQDKLSIGNLYAMRDWGHAKDYVKAYWLMVQQGEA